MACVLLTGCKGSSALKPCFLCQNVLNGHDKVQNHVHISCCDVHACHLQTQDNIIQIQSHLQTLLHRKEREEAEKLLGWHLHALSASILAQEDLRNWIPLSSLRYDAMHCFLANGIVPQELGLWYNCSVGQDLLRHRYHSTQIRSAMLDSLQRVDLGHQQNFHKEKMAERKRLPRRCI